MNIHWDDELGQLFNRLSAVQEALLSLLAKKHDLLLAKDHEALAQLLPQEQSLCTELQSCYEHRQMLLERADEQGLPSDCLRSLAGALPADQSDKLQQPLDEAQRRSRLLQHQSLTHWVVVQRTLLYLSHMLEIIATGGRQNPTYGKDAPVQNSGALMDQAA